MQINPFNKPTEIDKQLLDGVISQGDRVVDATCGNGHDTEYLANRVGDQGLVYAFDIQKQALETTWKRLQQEGLHERVRLLNKGHEKLIEDVEGPVSCVMFNLGYLPGSDKKVVTEPQNTIRAIEGALSLLKAGGLLTIVLYPGHETGMIESQVVQDYLMRLDQTKFHTKKIISLNFKNNPPYLMAVLKNK
ncbi:class I SAM-dependent methyltransferase [Natranaerobius thermophilus]|uniref:Putative rRNA methylase n=1 Tax=Natranaerobius thermophilus (strain ATCC BAA-1301 / DSM 18059 / JW/NM-WN-LF) TaxID=457570 RepID=B2A498_NATTJ|nr:class I SAM-dependent methyltransferase [Natranaerobius thermophilus]ACB83752.1 putative rRNA methylase [Natranaerobius thermophilus JW/NM-WN-LF]